MSQFRTTADILDEILTKSGEPTSGTSPYEARALLYANKVHHAIIGGGNIFDLTVDESWTWARSRTPIILELEPAYTTGTITATVNDTNIVFSSAPAASLEGWHVQAQGKRTVYKITKHTAADTAAVLDSSFLDDSGSYTFRAFKLDYEVLPVYLYVDNKNDRIDFTETAGSTLSATLTHGAYTPANLIAHVATQMGNTGTAAWTGAYDTVSKLFSLASSFTAAMLGATGPNKRRSAMPTLGLDRLNYTAAVGFTASYTPNSISRLVEPFKLFTTEQGNPFVYSTDPIKMQQDYPISLTEQRIPSRFVRLTEENDGTVWVRFSSYPRYKTKLSLDWIPVPLDLQDNAASFPELPRTDVDTLIQGATAYIQYDKEDSKWESALKLCGAGLQSMQKRNRSELFRTGKTFAQIVPRLDLDLPVRAIRYGYTVAGSTAAATTASTTQSMIAVTMSYTQFQTASTVATLTARTLPANHTLFALIVKHGTSFTGASMTAVRIDVGISGDPTKFINAFDVAQAPAASAQDSSLVLYYPATDTALRVRMTSVGANLTALAQGSLVAYFQETIVT